VWQKRGLESQRKEELCGDLNSEDIQPNPLLKISFFVGRGNRHKSSFFKRGNQLNRAQTERSTLSENLRKERKGGPKTPPFREPKRTQAEEGDLSFELTYFYAKRD